MTISPPARVQIDASGAAGPAASDTAGFSGASSSLRLPQRAQNSATRSFSKPQAMQIAFRSIWDGGLASTHSPPSKAYHLPLWAPMTQKRPSSSLIRSCFRESTNSLWEILLSLNFSRRRAKASSISRNWSPMRASFGPPLS